MTKIFKNKWFYVALSAIVLITVNNIFAFSDKYSDYRNSKETFREFYSRILKEMKYSDAYNVFFKTYQVSECSYGNYIYKW